MTKHFTHVRQLTAEQGMHLVRRAKAMKDSRFTSNLLHGKTIMLIFEKASTRTRISFDIAVRQLGGETIFMTPMESQLGRSEPLRDTARVLSRYADGMVVRTFGQQKLDELMAFGSIPVVNALTDQGHPCQVMSDMLTMYERTPDLASLTVAWVGDGNNMANSLVEAAMVFGFTLKLACPKGFGPDAELLAEAAFSKAKVFLMENPEEAVAGAHYVHTDVWASMGQEEEMRERVKVFSRYSVNEALMRKAAPGACFMHCLPAHRGEEVMEDVFEGQSSIVWDQAENRLHMQKAILEWVFTPE